ncbi:helix-turn-helix domain-containing protein [Brevundimonas balnearis]|uniref:Helix-turn-helix domain-containing protein n=1 Tax=Brevundimonas balnearis TaxID=1572858 RepID=A0ABV6R4Z2_9CAUL
MNRDIEQANAVATVTGAQLRAARGLLNMSVSDLSERTGLAINTIRKAEKTNGPAEVSGATTKLLVTTLEAAGVIFIPADQQGAGVRLQSPDQEPLRRRRDKGTA